jgi:O-antigen/teichoic acid export membrane protein
MAAQQIAGAWTNRIGAFHLRGASNAVTATTTVLGQLGAGFLRAGQAGLVLLALVGQLVGLLFLIRKVIRSRFIATRVRSFHTLRLAKEYSDMPRFSAPGAFLTTLSSSLPIFALTGLFGANAAGFFALAYRVTYLPVSVLGAAINQVFYREFARLRNSGESGRGLMLHIWTVMAAIAIVPMAILLFAGEHLFAFVFGNQWATAGKVAGVLSVGLFFNLVFGATSSSAVVLRLQHWSLAFSITSLIAKLVLISIGTTMGWTMLALVTSFVVYDCTEIVLMSVLILTRLSTTKSC